MAKTTDEPQSPPESDEQLIRILRERLPDTKIVQVVSNLGEEAQALAAGADDVIYKLEV